MSAGWTALAALLPLMVGPLPSEGKSLVASLCNGGSITLPLGEDGPEPDKEAAAKGCHAGYRCDRAERGPVRPQRRPV